MEIALHYYQFNIGDYRRDTQHLGLLEHGIYRQLIDTYYLNGGPLKADHDQLMRTHCIRSANEKQAYENIIKDFFETQDGLLIHRGCDKVITTFRKKSKSASDSANHRWEQFHANALRTQSEGNANHKPITINQQPVIKPAKQSKKITLGKYLEQCKELGVKAIPDNHALFDYMEKQSLPDEFVRICWRRFVNYYRDGLGSKKLYVDWAATFMNNVKNNYYKLWYLDDQNMFALTTAGKQAQKEFADHE